MTCDTHSGDSQPLIESQRQWTGKTRGGWLGNWIFLTLLRLCGLRAAYGLLVPVSFYYLFTAPKACRASAEYMRRLEATSFSTVSRLLRTWRHFFTFGQVLLDRVAIIAGPASQFTFEFDGRQHLEDALAAGKGLVLVTAHVGNWEAAGHALASLDVPVNVVAYEGEIGRIKQLFDGAMATRRFRLIPVRESLDTGLEIASALRNGEIVAMHADRAMGSRFVREFFLDEPAAFPAGPFYTAAACGAPVVTAFVTREGTLRYKFLAYGADWIGGQNRAELDRVVNDCVRRFIGRLEEVLKAHPAQWFNFYDFWGESVAGK